MSGKLYIVSTPIGNLEDITLRALRVLKEVDLIAAEDTRRAGVLLGHYGIGTKTFSFYSHNMKARIPGIIGSLKEGKNIAVITDSGTPGISDPGSILIRECLKEDVRVEHIPGATALISALVISGKNTDSFIFDGFLSVKRGKRYKQLEALLKEERTVVIYESPHRIVKTLQDIANIDPAREIVAARELTKKFEEVLRLPADKMLEHFTVTEPRGEFVLVF
ncbi:MAG: 16S rRNA (cytidine(1402)-2'-O)-methyltransferase [Candidatus Omnitrophica bacterium]|nr:16S rRNA (cytidine(1402)-2'-O)-methyltransferase [Candidatus Omnitrophota bacterium]